MRMKCNDSYIEKCINYIGDAKLQYFYLYADLLEFGTQGEDFGLWVFEDRGSINGVAYRYYDAMHLYSHDMSPKIEMLELIEELNPRCITGPQDLLSVLKTEIKAPYTEEIRYVFTIDHLLEGMLKRPFTEAKVEDVPDIAAIMLEDEVYKNIYSFESLCRQMSDGIREGKRRIYILKDRRDLLLASVGIYVETEKEALISGLITNKRVRGLGFGTAITAYVWNLVLKEGKQGVAFVNVKNRDSMEMHRQLGYKVIGTCERLVRNQ